MLSVDRGTALRGPTKNCAPCHLVVVGRVLRETDQPQLRRLFFCAFPCQELWGWWRRRGQLTRTGKRTVGRFLASYEKICAQGSIRSPALSLSPAPPHPPHLRFSPAPPRPPHAAVWSEENILCSRLSSRWPRRWFANRSQHISRRGGLSLQSSPQRPPSNTCTAFGRIAGGRTNRSDCSEGATGRCIFPKLLSGNLAKDVRIYRIFQCFLGAALYRTLRRICSLRSSASCK